MMTILLADVSKIFDESLKKMGLRILRKFVDIDKKDPKHDVQFVAKMEKVPSKMDIKVCALFFLCLMAFFSLPYCTKSLAILNFVSQTSGGAPYCVNSVPQAQNQRCKCSFLSDFSFVIFGKSNI